MADKIQIQDAQDSQRHVELPAEHVQPTQAVDESNKFAAQNAGITANILSDAGNYYDHKYQQTLAAQREINVSNEGADATRYSDQLIQQLKTDNTPLGEFGDKYQAGMQDYSQQRLANYSDDIQTRAGVNADLNRVSIVGQHQSFEYAQNKIKDQGLATTQDNYSTLLNNLPMGGGADNEAQRKITYGNIDSTIDGSVSAGYMSATAGEQFKRKARSDGATAVITGMLTDNDPKSAAAYLTSHAGDIDPDRAASIMNHIELTNDRLEKQQAVAEAKAERAQQAAQERFAQGDAVGALQASGDLPKDISHTDALAATIDSKVGGRTMNMPEAKTGAEEIRMADTPEKIIAIQQRGIQTDGLTTWRHMAQDYEDLGGAKEGTALMLSVDASKYPAASRNMVEAMQKGDAVKQNFTDREGVTGLKKDDLIASNESAFQNFYDPHGPLANQKDMAAAKNLVNLTTMAFMNQGYSQSDAQQKTLTALMGDNQVARPDGGKLPGVLVDSGMNPAIVEKGLQVWKAQLRPDDIIPAKGIGTPARETFYEKAKDYISEITSKGALSDAFWVTSRDDTNGLQYELVHGSNREPVMMKATGQPIVVHSEIAFKKGNEAINRIKQGIDDSIMNMEGPDAKPPAQAPAPKTEQQSRLDRLSIPEMPSELPGGQ